MQVELDIAGWAAWAPGLENEEAWANAIQRRDVVSSGGPNSDVGLRPNVSHLPMKLRRRLSGLGRMAMHVAYDTEHLDRVRVVFCSRHGDLAQTLGLLGNLAASELLSPTAFSLSVHNGLAGLLSIATKNRQPHTAIAAGEDSFCAGLVEAAALSQSDCGQPVLLIYCDEPRPLLYGAAGRDPVIPIALALLLSPIQESSGSLILQYGAPDLSFSPNHIDGAAITFLRFFLGQVAHWRWQGMRSSWRCDRVGAKN